MRITALIFASLTAAFVQAAGAQDIPSRVGRLAYTDGAVSVYQDPELGWDKAYVNTPITSENSVWTDRAARAEVRAGGIAVRLDDETQLDISRLDEDDFDAFVPRGSVNVRVRYKERNDHITFSTPHAQFVIAGDGRYRIDVDEDRDQSRLVVFAGSAYMEAASGRTTIEPGRMVVISGGESYFERARESALDRWAATRDQQWQDSRARSYVSSDMTGYEELDRYGSWAQDPDYGAIWYPTRVVSGWEPYRYGHWSYIRPWGWTWVDDQPWGYAPSHYGRWVLVRDRWAWAPGYARERPVWAPALVGFVGGAGFSFGISSGAPVGWYPLAPWERYEPWYRANSTYITAVNRHVVDRAPRWWQGRGDEWRHWNRDRATTVVNRDVFVNRRPVQSSVVRVNPETIRQAPVISSPQAVQQALPQRNEVLRFREANRQNVAAPTVMRQQPEAQRQPGAAPQATAPRQQVGQVVRPEFRRRGTPPVVAPAPAGQPPMSAPAPQQAQNPAERAQREAQQQQQQAQDLQRRREEAAQRANEDTRRRNEAFQRQQQEQAQRGAAEQQRQQQEAAQRAQQEQAQRAQQQQQQLQQQQQQAQERAQRETQRQQQEAAQRTQQEQAQRAQQQQQQQQAQELQRRREEAAQRAAEDTRRRNEAFQRQQQEQAQRAAAEQQRQQQEAAQRAQQQQQQRQQQEAAQRAQQQQQQQQQAQERAQREAQRQQQEAAQRAPQQQQQPQPQQQQQQQANPAARGDRGRGRDDDKDKDKDKDKEKDKDRR